MNFNKLYDDLQGIPRPALDAKARGTDPADRKTPPWLALAALNEIIDGKQRQDLAQGAAQGPMPSVKNQIQQKAGLMAAQAQQQQQAQQQMMQQMAQGPQPAPEGIPQPQAQPEPETFMAAGGGLARLPVDPRMFNYREGGVIGFAEGKEVPRYPGMIAQEGAGLLPSKTGYEGMSFLEFIQKFGMDAYNKLKNAIPGESLEERLARQKREVYERSQQGQRDKIMEELSKPEPVDSMSLPARPNMAQDPRLTAGLPAALPQRPGQSRTAAPAAEPSAAPRPAPRPAPAPQAPVAQAAAPAPGPQSAIEKAHLDALLAGVPKPPTMDELRAERRSATPELLNQPAGLAQLARLKQQQEQYDKTKEDRGLERLMQVLSARSQGGLGGFGRGYLTAEKGYRESDAAQAKYQNDVMTAIEAAQRGEATKEQEALLAGRAAGRTAEAEAMKNRLIELNKAQQAALEDEGRRAQNVSQEKIAAARDATSLQVAQIQAAATKLAAEGRTNTADARQTLAAAKSQMDSIQKEIAELSKNAFISANKARIAELRPQLDTLRQSIAVLEGGGTMPPSPGAAKAPALKYNPTTGKIE